MFCSGSFGHSLRPKSEARIKGRFEALTNKDAYRLDDPKFLGNDTNSNATSIPEILYNASVECCRSSGFDGVCRSLPD